MRSITITLPDDLARAVDAEIAAGRYASESDLALEGIAALLDDDLFDEHARQSIVAAYDEMQTDPSLGVPGNRILGRVQGRVHGPER